jgi:DNA-binding protein Fis
MDTMHSPFAKADAHLSTLASDRLALMVGRMSDIALVLDDENVIEDVSCSIGSSPAQLARDWTGSRFNDLLSEASAPKADALLKQARGGLDVDGVDLVHRNLEGEKAGIRYSAFGLADGDRVMMVGRLIPTAGTSADYRNLFELADVDNVEQATGIDALLRQGSMKDLVEQTRDAIERRCVEAALRLTGNNRAAAAKILGISRQALYLKLERFSIGSGSTS